MSPCTRPNSALRCVVALAGATILMLAATASAQSYPSRPIRLLVPLAPGGGNDTTARLIGHKLGEALGQQVVVDNRPGGGGVIAAEIAAKALPDGHTLYLASTSFTVASSLHRKLPFDPVQDFAAITRLAIAPGALIVHPSLAVNSARDLIALAKARPGQITFGSAGIGSGSHLGGELFNLIAGVKLLHVPYKGSALASTAVLAGEIAVAFTNPTSGMPHVNAGRLRMLAVTTAGRWPLLPEVPTLAESGLPGYEIVIWNGLLAPAKTPQTIIRRLHRELTQILRTPNVSERLAVDGSRPIFDTPDQFAGFINNEIAKWAKVVKAAGITAN